MISESRYQQLTVDKELIVSKVILINKDPYHTQIRSKRFVYYESIKGELKRRLIYEYRCDERLKTKNEESIRLVDTGLVVELEHLKTKTTRLKDEKFVSVKGECET